MGGHQDKHDEQVPVADPNDHGSAPDGITGGHGAASALGEGETQPAHGEPQSPTEADLREPVSEDDTRKGR
jgi:hypothetical protein